MANSVQLLPIAFRIFKRDWKRGDLLVLIFAMCIAMASVSVIYLVIDRIESATNKEVADILGADLVITSPAEIPKEWVITAQELGLEQATSIEFTSVLFANENIQLSSIKAITDNYPLKGSLHIASTPYEAVTEVSSHPAKGTLWIEPRIYNILDVKKAQPIELGYTDLNFDGVIMRQPGQGSTLFNVSPTAIMNVDDLESTQIVQPGSRVNYRYLYVGEQSALKAFAKKVQEEKSNSQRLVSIFDESPVAGTAVKRSKKYIGLSSLLTMVLLGVAIAMSANRYAVKQFDMSALMRCFGMSNNQVFRVFVYILAFVGIAGIIFGGLFGLITQELLVYAFGDLFVDDLPPADYAVLLFPVLATIVLLFGFSLPSLIQIKAVPPMRVLRRQLQPDYFSRWFIYAISMATLILVMWLQMNDLTLLLSVMLGLLVVIIVFAVIAVVMLKLMKAMTKNSRNAAINFSIRQLDAHKGITLLHLLAFSITIFVILLMTLVRTELVSKWQASLGDDVPNHFMINVKPDEVDKLQTFFDAEGLEFAGLYPMIRGRVTGINGVDVKQSVSETGQQHNSLRRELNITWSQSLPKGNEVVDGQWQWPEESDQALISIEDKTAAALGLSIGDVMDFTIGGKPWSAKIANIRSIDWQTFTPNFYIIANPGGLDDFSATYITSFLMPREKKPLLRHLIKEYPSVTVIELDIILEEIQGVIAKVTRAVELIMLFVVAAGMALLWSAMEHTFDSKFKQSAILRTLGASKSFIARSFRFEYFWLALLSSLMAVFAAEFISYILYTEVFDIEFALHWDIWWITPISTMLFMLIASWRGVKKVTEPSPLILLRKA